MKLNEIMNFIPRDTTRRSSDVFDRMYASKTPVLGNGYYSTAYDRNKGDVSKVGKAEENSWLELDNFNIEKDGYLYFVKFLHDHRISNPFFPKIKDIKLYRQKNTKEIFYTVNVEKLSNINDLSIDDFENMMKQFFIFDEKHNTLTPFAENLCQYLTYVVEDRDFELVRDRTLFKACKLLATMMDSNKNLELDISPDNIMMRGKQLVIMDPFIA